MAETKNAEDAGEFFEPGDVQVAEWHPMREGAGKPEQVHISRTMTPEVHIMVRLKSRAGALALIADLQKHVDNVWPPQ